MKSFLKWFLKFLWWLAFVGIAAVILLLVYRDWIVRDFAERQIRKATGLDAEIGSVTFSVLEPKLTFVNLRLYNSAEFGGTLLADIPELHAEFDRAALRKHELHLTLLRVNVNELDVVKNSAGATNLYTIAQTVAPSKAGGGPRAFFAPNGYTFTGIDMLNVSLGIIKLVDLKNQLRNRALAVGVQNKIIKNVKTPADLNGFGSQLWLRGAYMVGLPVHKPPERDENAAGVKLP